MNTRIEVTGIEEIEAALEQIAKRAASMRPVMEDIGGVLESTIHQSFENEQSPDGEAWSPLADSTIAYKEKHNEPFMLRSQDSTLFESIAYEADEEGFAVGVNAYSENKDGERYPYPIVHQFGTKDGRVPARRFMPIDSDGELDEGVKEELLELLEEFLADF